MAAKVMTAFAGLTKTGPGQIALTQRQPRGLTSDLVRIAVAATGVCGTDLHLAMDEYPSEPPVTMGHEISGTVTEVGANVSRDWLGVRVTCETYFSTCGTCEWCRDGRRNLCPRRRSIGSFEDGGFAREVVVPAQNLHALPAHVDSIAGSLCEPLACVCQCLLDPPIVNAGDRVLVVGPGAMGLLSAQVARAQGATVTCAGLAADASRLAVAEALDCRSALAAEVHDDDFDVVVECSGSAGGLATALRAVRRAGSLVQVGIFGREVPVPFDQILYKELTVTSGFASTAASWRRAMELLNARKVELAPLISDVVPLQEWQRALGLVGSGSALKVVIDPT